MSLLGINHFTYLLNCLPVDVFLECPTTYLCIVFFGISYSILPICFIYTYCVSIYIISLEWKC